MSQSVAFPSEIEGPWKKLGLRPWEPRRVALAPLFREMEGLGLEGNENHMRMQLQAVLASALGTREGLDAMLLGQLLVAASLIRRKREAVFKKALDAATKGDYVEEGTIYATTPEGSSGNLAYALRDMRGPRDKNGSVSSVRREGVYKSTRDALAAETPPAGKYGSGNTIPATPPTVPLRGNGRRGLSAAAVPPPKDKADSEETDEPPLKAMGEDNESGSEPLDRTQPTLGIFHPGARGAEQSEYASGEGSGEDVDVELLHSPTEERATPPPPRDAAPSPCFEEAEENEGTFQDVKTQLREHDRMLHGLQAQHGELLELLRKIEARQETLEARPPAPAPVATPRLRKPPLALNASFNGSSVKNASFNTSHTREETPSLAGSDLVDVDSWASLEADQKPALLSSLRSHYASLLSKNAAEQAETRSRLHELELVLSHMNTDVSADEALTDVAKLLVTRVEILRQRVETGLAAAGRFESKYFAKYDFVVLLLILFAVLVTFR